MAPYWVGPFQLADKSAGRHDGLVLLFTSAHMPRQSLPADLACRGVDKAPAVTKWGPFCVDNHFCRSTEGAVPTTLWSYCSTPCRLPPLRTDPQVHRREPTVRAHVGERVDEVVVDVRQHFSHDARRHRAVAADIEPRPGTPPPPDSSLLRSAFGVRPAGRSRRPIRAEIAL